MRISGNSARLAAGVVNGKTLYGTYGAGGSLLSQDGSTYVTPSGQVEHEITTR